MASKQFTLESIGTVTVYKRRGVRRINLRVSGSVIKVTQPIWLPYSTGLNFAESQTAWITEQKAKTTRPQLKNGQLIGKRHTLYFKAGIKEKTTVNDSQIIVTHSSLLDSTDSQVQSIAVSAIKRALKKEAEQLLPSRLKLMAETYGFKYESVRIRSMSSRWGSCTNNKTITLNCYLMMLPWSLIDYVLLHELTHTKHLHHGKSFWAAMKDIMPDTDKRKKELKNHQSQILPLQQS